MDRKVFFALATLAFLLFHLWLVYQIVAPFLRALGWAAVIGVVTYPLLLRLRERVGGNSTLAASILTPAVVLTLVVPVVCLLMVVTQETTQIYLWLQEATSEGDILALENLRQHPALSPWLDRLQPHLDRLGIRLSDALLPAVEKLTAFALSYSTAIVKNFFTFVVKMILMVITLFFIYRDGERFQRQFWSVIPLDEAHKALVAGTVRRVLRAVVYGIFLTCLVQGVLGGIGFWFSGLPSPVLFGAMMAVAALIPVVGTALIWAPAVVWLLLQGAMFKGIVLLIWGAFAVSSIDNLIRPFFISGTGKIPVLVVAIGALGGLVSFGLLGVVLGPLVLALFIAIFDIYREQIFPHDGPLQG